jgi:pyridoxamine--pyruvate transaminase
MRDPDFTLTAGPAAVTPTTLAALGRPILYHYDPVFMEAFRRTEAKVAEVFRTQNEIIIMQGEAFLGLEAAARSLVRPGMRVLNLVSGVFGKGQGARLKALGAEVTELEVAYNDAVSPGAVADYLDAHPDTELVALVHSETPSGTLHDCSAIGPIARAHGAVTLVDAVSSVGGVPFEADAWQLDVCVTGPHKCLAGPPGLALVSVSEAAWQLIEANPGAPRASYLSLLDWRERWHGDGRFPFTPLVSELPGLEAALDQVLAEGLEASFARHQQAAAVCRAGVRAMGLELWPRTEAIAADSLTAITVPAGIDHEDVRAHARSRYGVMISSGQGAGNLVRIGHMGPSANGLHPVVGLAALGRTLADLGADVRIGEGLDAALARLSDPQLAA